MRVRSWVVCLAVILFAAAAPNASATTTTFSTPFAMPLTSCTGDEVLLQGTQHFKFTFDPTVIDGLKYQVEINTAGVSGQTVTGVKYVYKDQSSEMNHSDVDDAQMTFEQTINMVRQGETSGLIPGDGDDLQFKILTHFTATNGMPKADQFEFRSDCR
jgi:hypothetical protein